MGTVTLDEQQQRRVDILSRLKGGSLSVPQAATLLQVSERQVRRLRHRYESEGMTAVLHGNRERTPHNKTDAQFLARIVALAGKNGPYHGFSVCHLQELLSERHEIQIARSTLDRLLKEQGVKPKPGRGRTERRLHRRRERQPSEGMLVQIDGSPHAWLEGRGPKLCLVGAIDDATSKVLYLRFHASESQEAYLLLLRTIAQEYGLPMAYYHDRHTILRSPGKATIEDELAGQEPRSQIQRVLHELGVESIAALSPQAKGRVERLWGTLQDRLVKEMRLEKIAQAEAANAFLPAFRERFNGRFAVLPADPEAAWVALPESFDRERHFSVQEYRTVRADQTLSFRGQTLLLTDRKRSYAGERVAVHVTPEGGWYVYGAERNRERLSFERREGSAKPPPPRVAPTPKASGQTSGQRGWLYRP